MAPGTSAYVDLRGYKEHMIAYHTGLRYQCDRCYKQFTRELSLRKHRKNVNCLAKPPPKNHVENQDINSFACPVCQLYFSGTKIKAHIETHHPGQL